MRHKIKHFFGSLCSFFIATVLIFTVVSQLVINSSGNERCFSGDADIYYQSLLDAGFPADYAVALTELHLLHPTWSFTPLKVTEQKKTYTWDYIISKETEDPSNNVIPVKSAYTAYWHETNRVQYDSGYYQASIATVEYFMDPRNFLNENDIFQFYSLAGAGDASIEAVKAVLSGTFMENTTLENGKTYAEYFYTLGKEMGINPIYLAVKVRQEQGTGATSPIISGKAGTKLNDFYQNQTQYTESGNQVLPPSSGYTEEQLLALDGYYNYFNIGATGNGVFTIYYKAMQRAIKGTESMASKWDGSPSWNTRWKSLYGGADFLKTRYIDQYKSTIYLQKFNVDSRASENFTGQYMTAVYGAMNEGRSFYQSLAAIDALDLSYSFLIPVYEGMPETPCADPASGSCTYLAQATTKYSYQAELTAPDRRSATSSAVYINHEVMTGGKMELSGVMTHTYGIKELQYSWDGGDWKCIATGNQFKITLIADFYENTSHILVIRGKAAYDPNNSARKSNSYFLCAVIYVKVVPPPSVTLSFEVGNTVTDRTLYAGTEITLPESDAPDFAGWLGSDGSFLPSGAQIVLETDVTYSAIFLSFEALEGAALSLDGSDPCLRFYAVMREDSYQKLQALPDKAITLSAVFLSGNTQTQAETLELTSIQGKSRNWTQICAETAELSSVAYKTDYSALFYAQLHYTDGTVKTLTASGEPFTRNVKSVATAALADASTEYPPEMLAKLKTYIDES